MSIPPKEEQLSQCPGMTKHRAKLSVHLMHNDGNMQASSPTKANQQTLQEPGQHEIHDTGKQKTSESYLPGAPHPHPQARKPLQWTATAEPKPKPNTLSHPNQHTQKRLEENQRNTVVIHSTAITVYVHSVPQ